MAGDETVQDPTGGRYPFGSRAMSAATGRAERPEGLGFPRDTDIDEIRAPDNAG